MLSKLRDPSEKTLAVLLLAPAFALLLAIVVYPIGKLIYNSLFAIDKDGAFLGLQNYIDVWQDPLFWNATQNTLLITLITVPGALLVGLALALLANLPFKRKWPVRLSLLLPWALPLSFAGLIFAWFFHTEYGVVNDVLMRLGLQDEPTSWLLKPRWAFAAICLTIIWKTSVLHGVDFVGRLANDSTLLVRSRRGGRRHALATVLANHHPHAHAQHHRGPDFPNHHSLANL